MNILLSRRKTNVLRRCMHGIFEIIAIYYNKL